MGRHCGRRADDYHYHIAPLHLQAQAGRGMPVAYAPMVIRSMASRSRMARPWRTSTSATASEVAHMAIITMRRTSIRMSSAASTARSWRREQVDPQPRAQGVREALTALRGAKITAFESTGKDSYKLSYDVNGDKRSVSYSIKADGTYPFHFDNGREGTADEVYTARRQGGGGGGGGGDRPPGGGGPGRQ